MPAPSIHAEVLAEGARATAELAGKKAIDVAWHARARAVAEGRDTEAAWYLEALAVLGEPGAVVAAVLTVEPDAVPHTVLVDAARAGRRGSDGGAA
jgi:hypothetical protein